MPLAKLFELIRSDDRDKTTLGSVCVVNSELDVVVAAAAAVSVQIVVETTDTQQCRHRWLVVRGEMVINCLLL